MQGFVQVLSGIPLEDTLSAGDKTTQKQMVRIVDLLF